MFDTRSGQGPTGDFVGKREGGETTTYQVAGLPVEQGGAGDCGIPNAANAVLINLVAIQPEGVGNLRAFATGTTPTGGVVNFAPTSPAMNNSNAVVVPLSADGEIDLFVNSPSRQGQDAAHVRGVVLGFYIETPS